MNPVIIKTIKLPGNGINSEKIPIAFKTFNLFGC